MKEKNQKSFSKIAKKSDNISKGQTMKLDNSKLRAVGYCRTSSEGQRDNTSIPRQKAEIERFAANNEWKFLHHYIDESLSGAKIDGRDSFKRMLGDAANGRFDIVVSYDITRFSRDGFTIVSESNFLKKNFGINVIDTKGFDTRDHRNSMMNYVRAGMSEDEKLRIMDRTIGGRIENAKNGLQWSPNLPAGRGFKKTGKGSGEWFITEQGHKLAKLLKRYADGESLKSLAKEYGFLCPAVIIRNIHKSQLSDTYYAQFNAPEIGINNLKIPVPAVPEIISPELERRVKERLAHNRSCNKQGLRKYLLTGFVKCSHCNRSLVVQKADSYIYYRHYESYATSGRDCPYCSIRSSLLESSVLDYLYGFFLDEPAYNEAIKRALPSDEDRKALEADIKQVEKRISKVDKSITNLVSAVADGADVSLLLDKQVGLKAEKQVLESRRDELTQTLAAMPNPEHIKEEAMLLRIHLIEEHKGKDWRKLSYEDIRKFLHFLFGNNPMQTGYGIFVGLVNNKWNITFKGCVDFYHDVIDGRPVSHILHKVADTLNKNIKRTYDKDILEVERAYKQSSQELNQSVNFIKPYKDN